MYPEEFYEFEQMLQGIDEDLVFAILGLIGAIVLVAVLVGIVCYIFESIGLYSIAKRRGIENPWLAWIPVGNYWIVGSIADQYRYVVKGEVKNKRFVLLALGIAGIVISGLISSMGTVFVAVESGSAFDMVEDVFFMQSAGNLVTTGINVATLIFWNLSLYDLYTSCNPKNNVLFLVLGIIFPFLTPFFIFSCRKKELGMPPRREVPPEERYREPWNNQ